MYQPTTIQEPSFDEQVVSNALQSLHQLEELYAWDFSGAIGDIKWLYEAHGVKGGEVEQTAEVDSYQAMKEYAESSGKEVRTIVALNRGSK